MKLLTFLFLWRAAETFAPTVRYRPSKESRRRRHVVLFQQQKQSPRVTVPPDFEVPEPQLLTLTRSENLGDAISSSAALAVRLGTGAFVLGWKIDSLRAPEDDEYALQLGPLRVRDSSSVLQNAPRPDQPIILYEYDASPFCKRVREAINLLDLSRRTVPYLIDPNTEKELFESADIIEYLLQTYGPPQDEFDRKALWPITLEPFSLFTSGLAAILRDMPGSMRQSNARPDNEQMQPLELWGYECSPFVRPVREKLCSLCLPHKMVSCSRGSVNRNKLKKRTGRFQVPFLVDPNTGIEMFESAEIVEYLDKVYTIA